MEDPDGDGLTTRAELVDFGTDFQVADTDGDGLADGEEVTPGADGFVTSPLLTDTDGDGLRDGLEVDTGSDPTDPASFNLAQALASLDVTPPTLSLRVNALFANVEVFQQLTVIGQLIDGNSIDLTSTARQTTYASDDLTVCNFGGDDGVVFAAEMGSYTITVANNGFSADVTGTVEVITPGPLARLICQRLRTMSMSMAISPISLANRQVCTSLT